MKAITEKKIQKIQDLFTHLLFLIRERDDKLIEDYTNGVYGLISKECHIPYHEAVIGINFLEKNNYVQKIYEGKKLISLVLLKTNWEGLPKETIKAKKEKQPKPRKSRKPRESKKAAIVRGEPEAVKPKYVLMVDWRNLELGSVTSQDAIETIINLERTLIEKGSLEAKFVFVPEHQLANARTLSSLYRYFIIVCPKSFITNGNAVVKDKDTVDWRMTNLGNFITLWSNIDTFVVVSGDGDFIDFMTYAKDHGKKVIIAAKLNALSSTLEKIADDLILL